MLQLLLLGFVGLTIAFPYFPGPPAPLPFYVPWGAQPELDRIQNDPSLTKKQFEDQMDQWANKNGLKDQYDAYKKEMEDAKKHAEEELDEALKELPKFFEELRKIENDDSLTEGQAAQKKQKLFDKLTPKQAEAAQFLEHLFAPNYAQDPAPGPSRPGPMRPGPMGPGPMGPGPMGPGPMGPMRPGPMRPGPMGPSFPFGPFSPFW